MDIIHGETAGSAGGNRDAAEGKGGEIPVRLGQIQGIENAVQRPGIGQEDEGNFPIAFTEGFGLVRVDEEDAGLAADLGNGDPVILIHGPAAGEEGDGGGAGTKEDGDGAAGLGNGGTKTA